MMEDLLDFRTFKETLGTNGFRDIKVSENSICCKAIICEHTTYKRNKRVAHEWGKEGSNL